MHQISNIHLENLEVEDAGVVLREALIRRNHSVQQLLVHCQTGDGSQQPAVTYQRQFHELRNHLSHAYGFIKYH